MRTLFSKQWILSLMLVALPARVVADQVLVTSSFSPCQQKSNITVTKLEIQYNNDNKTVTFNVAGSSTSTQNVTATLDVTAYGNSVYSNSFNPCDKATFVKQLCPVPVGSFSASGTQKIPDAYASLVPAIAFQIPDIAAMATLQLKALDGGGNIACIKSEVSNGKTANVPAISYVAASIAGVALVAAGASAVVGGALGAVGTAGAGSTIGGVGTVSPSFVEILSVFQGFAMNGMLSVNYPPIYRSFSKNFGFSAGIISWEPMQRSIDSFRAMTGGNTTQDNVQFLKNATLVFGDSSTNSSVVRRTASNVLGSLHLRQITTSVNTTAPAATTESTDAMSQIQLKVSGIAAYVEGLSVPQSNTFMTVLLIITLVIAVIVVGILFFKVILETWALFGSFPKGLSGFREHYWNTIAKAITQLIFILYGIWVLYCIFQFTHGDSIAAKVLAGVTLGIFTAILAFFTFRIWQLARRSKEIEGDASMLYDDKEVWIKYSLFYESFKKNFWWTFVPVIVYMAAKGAVLAAMDGHGLIQSISQLVIEALLLGLLIFSRPYERKSGNVINIFIQVVRVLSVVCILVFVEELGIAQTTQTVTGLVLIVVQSVLTGTLAILLIVNAIVACFRANPHRKRRKEAEKANRDLDNLTPLDARNSLLVTSNKSPAFKFDRFEKSEDDVSESGAFKRILEQPRLATPTSRMATPTSRLQTPVQGHIRAGSSDGLFANAAPLGRWDSNNNGSQRGREPMVPNLDGYGGYRGTGY